MRAILAVVLLGATFPGIALAGAWTRERGEAYVKAAVARLTAEEMYDRDGEREPLSDPALFDRSRYLEIGAALYGEYGLRGRLTLLGYLPFKVVEFEGDGPAGESNGEDDGFGDLHLGARLQLHRGSWLAALEPDLKLPLYSRDEGGAEFVPPLGSGFVDFGAAVSVGASIPRANGYAQGSLGYRIRGGSTGEEWYGALEGGLEPWRGLRMRLRFDAVDSEDVGDGVGTEVEMGAPVPEAGGQDYGRIAPTLATALGDAGEISLTWRGIVDGRNTARSSEWEIAFTFMGRFLPAASAAP